MQNKETFVADVRRFTELAGCTTDQFNVRQTALYIGLQLEEMAEKLRALLFFNDQIIFDIEALADRFKSCELDWTIPTYKRDELLDADVDLAWVTIGSMLSQGADVLGAMKEVARANLDKFPGGVVTKDENGKVVKPNGWREPDLLPYVSIDAAMKETK